MAYTVTQAHDVIWAESRLRAVSGFMVLLWPGFELISMAPVTIKGHAGDEGLVSHLRRCWYMRAMLPQGLY